MDQKREISVWSPLEGLVDEFITAIENNPSFSLYNIKLSRNITPQTKGFVFLCDHEMSFDLALEKCSGISLPKFIIQRHTQILGFVQDYSVKIAEKRVFFSKVNFSNPSSVQDIVDKLGSFLEKGYNLLSFKLNYKGVQIIKWSSFIFSLLSALLSLVLIFIAGIIAISKSSVEKRWFANSLLTAGNLTFVMSFVGFYGVKKTGIKEYLKIYSGVLLINALYKIILIIIYSQMGWYLDINYLLYPIIIINIVLESMTSVIILLELSVVKTSNKDISNN